MTDAPATNELLGHFPLQYSDGPDYCTVKDATGADFALTVQPDLMRLMEDALRAAATPSAQGAHSALAQLDSEDANPAWNARTHDEIIKRLMSQVGMPNSMSLYQAFKQFANELHALSSGLRPDASPGNGAEKVSREDEARSLIEAERQRQIDDEGYDTSHDDEHKDGELLRAGMCYLNQALVSPYSVPVPPGKLPMGWPWANQYWKPKDARRNLVKGGALLLAERDRLRRAGRYHGHADHKIELAVRRLAALHSTSAAGETTSSDGAESQREVQAQMGPAKTKASPSALGAGDRPSEAIPADVVAWSCGSCGDSDVPEKFRVFGSCYKCAAQRSLDKRNRKIASLKAAVNADVLAMKEACKRAALSCEIRFYPYASSGILAHQMDYARNDIAAAIDKLSPEVTAEGGRGEPVADKPFGHFFWCSNGDGTESPDFCQGDIPPWKRSVRDVKPLYTHSASPPDVEAIRANERERCATEVERRNWPTVGDARRISSAIRTGGQKK